MQIVDIRGENNIEFPPFDCKHFSNQLYNLSEIANQTGNAIKLKYLRENFFIIKQSKVR